MCWRATRCAPQPILGLPLAAFTLLHRKGYFQQHLDGTGQQTEDVQPWNPEDFCTEEPEQVAVWVEGRTVTVRAWRYDLEGCTGHVIPIYCSIQISKSTRAGTAVSPTIFTAATQTIACNRR